MRQTWKWRDKFAACSASGIIYHVSIFTSEGRLRYVYVPWYPVIKPQQAVCQCVGDSPDNPLTRGEQVPCRAGAVWRRFAFSSKSTPGYRCGSIWRHRCHRPALEGSQWARPCFLRTCDSRSCDDANNRKIRHQVLVLIKRNRNFFTRCPWMLATKRWHQVSKNHDGWCVCVYK